MRSNLIFLLTHSTVSLVFDISNASVGPLRSRQLTLDLLETGSDLSALHVERHQALSTKSIGALKHRCDDALTNHHDALSMSDSASTSSASISLESRLSASAIRNRHESLEEHLRGIVKFLGEMVPVSLFNVKKDGHKFLINAQVRSFDENLNTKPLRLRFSDKETSRRCLRPTSPLQIPVDVSIVILPRNLAAAHAGRGLARLPTTKNGWIVFGVLVGPIWISIFLIGCFLLYSILRRCFESDDPIPASTESPHELR
jgi:hypothetical protein